MSIVADIDTTWPVNDELEVDSTGASFSATYGTATISLVAPIPDFISVVDNIVTFAPTLKSLVGPHSYTIRQEAPGCETQDTVLSVTVIGCSTFTW